MRKILLILTTVFLIIGIPGLSFSEQQPKQIEESSPEETDSDKTVSTRSYSLSSISTSPASISIPTASTASFNISPIESFQTDLFSGRASFGIPIIVPPGRRGIQPALSLNYSSSQANGICGVGWDLSLASIERSTKKGIPKYDNSDTFIFSSNSGTTELINIGANEYRSKTESGGFMKFLFYTTYWEATDKSGTKYIFGINPSSRIDTPQGTFKWCLEKVIDLYGNYLTVTYQKDNNQIYPQRIEYTGNESTGDLPKNTVDFMLEDRLDITTNLRSGTKQTQAKRLKSIDVEFNNELVRRYILDYQTSNSKRSLLTTITQYGQDGITNLPPIRFTYQQKNPSFDTSIQWQGIDNQGSIYYGNIRYTFSSSGYDSIVALDLLDINGDGLPDRVMRNDDTNYLKVQLNSATGFEPSILWGPMTQTSFTLAYCIRYVTGGTNCTTIDTIDINGDGLPDRLDSNIDWANYWKVQLNNGRGFDPQITWPGIDNQGSIYYGQIRYPSGSNTEVDLLDINGDGLLDRVMRYGDNNYFKVQLNNGTGFEPAILWGPIYVTYDPYRSIRHTTSSGCTTIDTIDINGDGLPDRIDSSIDWANYWKVQLNNGKGFDPQINWPGIDNQGSVYYGHIRYSFSSSGYDSIVALDLFDINGDGLPDRVMRYGDNNYFKVQLNNGSGFEPTVDWGPMTQTSTLAYSIRYVTGGTNCTTMDTIDINGDGLPDRLDSNQDWSTSWKVQKNSNYYPDLLSSVENGLGGSIQVQYKPSTIYDNTGTDELPDLPFPVYTVNSITYSDGLGNSYTTGYEYKDGLYDSQDREFRGFGYVKVTDAQGNYTENFFKQDDIYKGRPYLTQTKDSSGNIYTKAENTWANTQIYPGYYFVYLAQTDNFIYDGDISYKQTRATYQYDQYGNPTIVRSEGDITVVGDEKESHIEYTYNTVDWILSAPNRTYLLDQNNNKVSEKWFYYDYSTSLNTPPQKGLLTKEEIWLYNPLTLNFELLTTNYQYNQYGNLIQTTDALGRTLTTEYEIDLHQYPIKITNMPGHTQQSTYDYKTGQILTSIDPNGKVTQTIYDSLARPIKIIGPLDTIDSPGIIYEYDLLTVPIKVTKKVKTDYNTPANYTTGYSFYDGLGRLIQTRSQAEDLSKQVISGAVTYDQRGQVKEKYLPYFEDYSVNYQPPQYTTPHATFTYDAIGRLIQATNPDLTARTTQYSDWQITNIDENNHKIVSTYNAYGQLITQQEHNSTQIYTTTYQYDTLGNLIKVTDNQNNITTITYDSLGRKLAMSDPDMGNWSYSYDKVGNLISQTDAKNQIITFTYDSINRLTWKGDPITLATYQYDDITQPNRIGRLSKIQDSSGSTEFFYDVLGREIKTEKTVVSTKYTVLREYDALDRLTKLTYPDGEIITYSYDNSGAIESVVGNSTYVQNIDYNANGQIAKIQYGNNTYTDYTYNPNTLRLTHLTTNHSSLTTKLQDLSYQFDNVGNVTQIQDTVNSSSQTFQYDDLNRLTYASGTKYGVINYTYDSIGNLTSKNSTIYQYGLPDGSKPHAVTRFGDVTINYDANGNMIKKGDTVLTYDSENRLKKVENQSQTIETVSISLQPGWNFISIPVIPVNNSISSVLSNLRLGVDYDQVTRFNPDTKQFEHYIGNSLFDQFNTIEYGKGYQIYITNPNGATLSITGTVPQTQDVILKSGWNLIANPNLINKSVESSLDELSFNIDYDQIASYNTTTQLFENYPGNLNQLEKGKAYYLYCLPANKIWTIRNASSTTEFIYDGDGGRVKKSIVNSQQSTVTTYIGSLYEVDSDGTIRKHIFAGANRICTSTSASALTFYHQDHIGSSNVITDQSGTQVQLLEYEPYGTPITNSGTTNVKHKFTGKELDDSTGLYFYGARYYDPELGRFITADPTIQRPYDPQDLNRYTYCRNNPINYTDPTGLGWFSKFWQSIVGVATTAISILAPPLAPAMWAINFAISAYTAIDTGNYLGFAGGIIGGAVFGAIGKSLAAGIAGTMSNAFANSFIGGAIIGAVEFGIGGFGAGLGSALASGASFSDAIKAGGFGAATGAAFGAVIQGSYMAGWQDSLHGLSKDEIAQAAGIYKKANEALSVGKFFKKVGPDRERAQAYYYQKGIRDTDKGLFKEYLSFARKNNILVNPWESPIKQVISHNNIIWKWLQPTDVMTDIYAIEKLDAFNTARGYMLTDPDQVWTTPVDIVKDAFKIAY